MLKNGPRTLPETDCGSLLKNYLRLLRQFRRQDLRQFCETHEQLFAMAKRSGDHVDVTRHYYNLMATVIATYYGEGWHFCPPEFVGQTRQQATHRMYRIVSDRLGLAAGQRALDIGCGVGGMLRFLTRESGATMTGLTLGDSEVQQANQLAQREGLGDRCQVQQGDSRQMPFADHAFDSAYAVYALKYYPQLEDVFREIHRVLKPGGRFVAYCLCKSRDYREHNPRHAKLLQDFEYSTAMPKLHSVEEIIRAAGRCGVPCLREEDLSTSSGQWYTYWVRNPVLPWLVRSKLTYAATRACEAMRILPPGFARFNDTFLAGTLRHLIRAGQLGILTGSALLTFAKK